MKKLERFTKLPEPWRTILEVGERNIRLLARRDREPWTALAISLLSTVNDDIRDYYWRTGRTLEEWASPYANAACPYYLACGKLRTRYIRPQYGVPDHMLWFVHAMLMACAEEIEALPTRALASLLTAASGLSSARRQRVAGRGAR
jgi:hypothetical protein